MTVQESLLVLAWIIILLLCAGLGGLLRAVRLLDQRITESFGEPRRLQVGDRLTIPEHLVPSEVHYLPVVLFFGKGSCSNCVDAYRQLLPLANQRVILRALWRDSVPDAAVNSVSFGHQLEVFERLKVGVAPFGVLVEAGVVTVRSGLGSPKLVSEFAWHVLSSASEHHGLDQTFAEMEELR
jgi:hypothetical protein